MLPVSHDMTANRATAFQVNKKIDENAARWRKPNQAMTGQSGPPLKGSLPLALEVTRSLRPRTGRISSSPLLSRRDLSPSRGAVVGLRCGSFSVSEGSGTSVDDASSVSIDIATQLSS